MMKAVAVWCRDKLVSTLEESPGVMSSSRVIALILTLFGGAIVVVTSIYTLRGKPDAGVILSLSSVLTALIGGGAVALVKRN